MLVGRKESLILSFLILLLIELLFSYFNLITILDLFFVNFFFGALVKYYFKDDKLSLAIGINSYLFLFFFANIYLIIFEKTYYTLFNLDNVFDLVYRLVFFIIGNMFASIILGFRTKLE